MNGNSLNVQGPPGTGKSQTIVNIIANLLARDKTVLLVCEKQVALEVVLNRLKEVGLDKLCLPLFKYNTDKKTFAKSIVDDRNAMSRISQDNRLEGELVHRENIIERLRQYAEALGTVVEPLEKSVFWVHGELAKHKKNTSAMIPWKGDDPLNVSYESYRNAEKILNSLEPLMKSVHDDKNLYWRVVTKEQFSPDYFSRIQLILKSSADNLRVITQNESVIASWKNIGELKHYLVIAAEISDLPQLPESLVGSSLGENLITVLNDMTRVLKKFSEKEKLFDKKFVLPDKWTSFNYKSENIFDQDLELSQLNLVSSSFFEIDNLLQTSTEILD